MRVADLKLRWVARGMWHVWSLFARVERTQNKLKVSLSEAQAELTEEASSLTFKEVVTILGPIA
jgi:hypothetical protein